MGKILSRDEKAVVLEHPVLGRIRLPADKIKPAAPAKPKPKPPAAKAAPKTEKYERQFLKDWKMQASLGVSQTQGNRDTSNIRLGFKTSKSTKQSRWKINLAYALAERDGKRSENAMDLGIQKDWLFPESPWFLFVESRFKSDQFKHWDHRLSLHGGLGYDLKPKHGVPVTARIGGGVTKEFGGVSDDLRPESLVGGELNWQINPRQKLLIKSTLYPSVESESEFRIETDAGWSIKL
ncbi:MAG: DUF481 domain-containing protein, partial [Phycisphaerae bacterium]|nr:DUF481 domain-containing protein [Phycisphaerae bacterium]